MVAAFHTALQQVTALTGKAPAWDDAVASYGYQFASALGWQQGNARLEPITLAESGLSVARGYLGAMPAAVFADSGRNYNKQEALSEVARYAYHLSVHWGVVTDEEGAVIFNSHWLRDDQWFHLPELPWIDIDRHSDAVQAITPQGVVSGQLDRFAQQIYAPDRPLTPVDDALVARLEYWRRAALRHGRDIQNLDGHIHTLFTQLFVLRTIEDRQLAPQVLPLATVIGPHGIDREQLRRLLEQARQDIQSELFVPDAIIQIPDFVLEGIIRDLYIPSELPIESRRYDFSWIDADILGRAYEKYLSNIFAPAPPSPQLSFFEPAARELETVSVKRSGGIYYTPEFLVRTLSEQAVREVLSRQPVQDYIPSVADFACGSGSFIIEAVDVMLRHLRQSDPDRDWVREIVENRRVVGIDIDARAVKTAQLRLWTRLTSEPNALPLPSLNGIFVHGDSLGEDVWHKIPASYDVVLGNPPFLATQSQQPREDLAKRFKTARGRYDYAHLFLELAVKHLSPDGALGMVVPNRIFRNRDAGPVRDLLSSETDLISVIDFGSNQLFSNANTYIGAVIARRRDDALDHPRPATVRIVLVSDTPDTQYLAGMLADAILSTQPLSTDTLEAFDITYPVGSGRWALMPPSVRAARIRLEQDASPLAEVAETFQGIRTGANDIFILRLDTSDGVLSRVVNGLDESAIIESDLLHPVVFGSDIQRYGPLVTDRILLYPYHDGITIPEADLADAYPNAYRYLRRYQSLLSARSTVIRGGRWYELAWKRDETWLTRLKLLTRDLAPRTSFTIDLPGDVFLVGGTAVVPHDEHMALPLLAYLNSSIADEYLSEVTPSFRGAFKKFEPQHLHQLPVPTFLINPTDVSEALSDLAQDALMSVASGDDDKIRLIDAEIDRRVAEAVGISWRATDATVSR